MTKNNNLSTIVFIIIIALLSGGIIAGGVYYLTKNNELKTKINQRESELMQMKQKAGMLPKLREQGKKGIAEINKLHRFVPNREEQAAFVLELERMARSCGVDILLCKMDDKEKSYENLPTYKVYQWVVELNGEYHGIRKLLESILESKRFMMISGLNISASEPDSKSMKAYKLNSQLVLDLIAPVEQGKVDP